MISGKRQHHRPCIQVELPGADGAETDLSGHLAQHRSRVISAVAVTQGVPHSLPENRGKGVELNQQHASGRKLFGTQPHGKVLVRIVHHAEGIDHDVCRSLIHLAQAVRRHGSNPGSTMGTGVFQKNGTVRWPNSHGSDSGDGVPYLGDQREGFHTPCLIRTGRIRF